MKNDKGESLSKKISMDISAPNVAPGFLVDVSRIIADADANIDHLAVNTLADESSTMHFVLGFPRGRDASAEIRDKVAKLTPNARIAISEFKPDWPKGNAAKHTIIIKGDHSRTAFDAVLAVISKYGFTIHTKELTMKPIDKASLTQIALDASPDNNQEKWQQCRAEIEAICQGKWKADFDVALENRSKGRRT